MGNKKSRKSTRSIRLMRKRQGQLIVKKRLDTAAKSPTVHVENDSREFCTVNEAVSIESVPFPRDPYIKEKWRKYCNTENDSWKPTRTSVICSEHFTPESYKKDTNMKTLIEGAIPSVRFCPCLSAAARLGPAAEPCPPWPETSCRSDPDNSDTNLPSITADPLNKGTIDQCRFCGDFTKDCIDLATNNKPYIDNNKTSLTVNGLSVELDFNDDTLPKTVCHNCDGKLQQMFDFVKQVEVAQDALINVSDEIETVIVKVEEPQDDEDEQDDEVAKEVCETQYEAKTSVFTHKRKSSKLNVQQKKRKISPKTVDSELIDVKKEVETDKDIPGNPDVANVTAHNNELAIGIKEENIEIDSHELHSEIDTGVDVKPDEQELATHALAYEMAKKRR